MEPPSSSASLSLSGTGRGLGGYDTSGGGVVLEDALVYDGGSR